MNRRDEIEKIASSLEYFCNNSYLLVKKFRENIANSDDDEELAIAQCLLQVAVCRVQSLLKLSSGICIVPNKNDNYYQFILTESAPIFTDALDYLYY